jgi:hypothetical protein
MRLKRHDQPATRPDVAGRLQGLTHRGRVMSVVVHQRDAFPGADPLEATPDSRKLRQTAPDLFGSDAQFITDGRGCQRIQDIVSTGNRQAEFHQKLPAAKNPAASPAGNLAHIARPPVRLTALAKSQHRRRCLPCGRLGGGIIKACQQKAVTGNVRSELAEGSCQVFRTVETIKMVRLD